MGIFSRKKAPHIIVMAGNRMGKDTGIIVPLPMLNWPGVELPHPSKWPSVRLSTGPASPADAHAAINRKKS